MVIRAEEGEDKGRGRKGEVERKREMEGKEVERKESNRKRKRELQGMGVERKKSNRKRGGRGRMCCRGGRWRGRVCCMEGRWRERVCCQEGRWRGIVCCREGKFRGRVCWRESHWSCALSTLTEEEEDGGDCQEDQCKGTVHSSQQDCHEIPARAAEGEASWHPPYRYSNTYEELDI